MRQLIGVAVALATILALAVPAFAQDAGYEPPPLPTEGEIDEPENNPPRPVAPPSRDRPEVPPAPPSTTTLGSPPTGLAATGLGTELALAVAAVLLLAGAGMVMFTRRRKDAPS